QAVEQPIVVAVSVTSGGTRVTAQRRASAERLAQPDGISIFYLALEGPTKAAGNLAGTPTA
ncbi:MAG TPA: hypothetical protein VII16_12955, partial [Actinomycetes bacterium]